jgi:hypothetical protein
MVGNSNSAHPAHGFDERDRAILDFEREWWQHPGGKEEAIRQTFGLSPARYYQVLTLLIDSPDALAYDPMLIKRLQRSRDERRKSREERIHGD